MALFSYDQHKFGYTTDNLCLCHGALHCVGICSYPLDSGITYPTKLVILLEMENLSHKNVIENIFQESKRVKEVGRKYDKTCLQNQVDTVTCIVTMCIFQLRAIQEHTVIDTFVMTSVNLWFFFFF